LALAQDASAEPGVLDAVPSGADHHVPRASADRGLHHAGAFAARPGDVGCAAAEAELSAAVIPAAASLNLAVAGEPAVQHRHFASPATRAVRLVLVVVVRHVYLVRDVRGGACVLCHRDLRQDGSIHFPYRLCLFWVPTIVHRTTKASFMQILTALRSAYELLPFSPIT